MASHQARQLKKRKKREQDNKRQKLFEVQRQREHEWRRRYESQYPEFRFDTTQGNTEFVKLVKSAVATIHFDDASVFPEWQQELYRILKRGGNSALRDRLLVLELEAAEAARPLSGILGHHFMVTLGQELLNRIAEGDRERYLPLNDFLVVPGGQHILVLIRSLLTAKGPGGTVYYSRRKPMLDIDGSRKIVAFSKHAIERTCERIKPHWKNSYAALGDVFAFFDQCMYFERQDLNDGQLGFTFYDGCEKQFVQYAYVTQVLGKENLDSKAGKPYYRLGYCPAVIEGDFIKAKTFLFPGYASTPEYDRLRRSSLPWCEKEPLLAQATSWDAWKLYDSQDFSLIRWFHDNGVPQVVQIRREVFADVR
ncbi:MAG: hypothetical protein ACYC0X_12260 [Pirellulaceae bacterium]